MERNEMLSAIENKVRAYPIMIGDVLDFVEKKWDNMGMHSTNVWQADMEYRRLSKRQEQETNKVIWGWKTKREPLDHQDDDCIQYVYNLIK